MTRLRQIKTNFTAGELSPDLIGRGDLRAYENGARTLRNVFIRPTGGVSRRAGLRFIDTLPGLGRLVAFEFNTEQVYLLVFTDFNAAVYRDGVKLTEFVTPWAEGQLSQLAWTQSADTLLVVHPDVPPQQITRSSDVDWTTSGWIYVSEQGRIQQPFHRFAPVGVTLTPSATTGTITITASQDWFEADHQQVRLRLDDKEVHITGVTSGTQVQATVIETLISTNATENWEEQVFSPVQGYPISVAFHQDRLVIGGSRDLPNRLWMSRSSDLFNFDLGTGLDDEAISFALLSDQLNAIRAVFSGRHLQVFTSGAEWMVTGDPLTPSTVQVRRQTRIGSPVSRHLPPRDVDGATLFLARNGNELREFLFTDAEQAYRAADLALASRHLLDEPVDLDFDQKRRLFHVVMADGSLAALTIYRAEQVTAWTRQETDGQIENLAVVGEDTYIAVTRNNGVFIEIFDDALNTDSALTGSSGTPASVWSGLDHMEGHQVRIIADGIEVAPQTVDNGEILLETPASEVEIGLAYTHTIEPLPPVLSTSQGVSEASSWRLVKAIFRVLDTASLSVDSGSGPVALPFQAFDPVAGAPALLDTPPALFSGDKTVRATGWSRGGKIPWRVVQDAPRPCTILSVLTEMKVID